MRSLPASCLETQLNLIQVYNNPKIPNAGTASNNILVDISKNDYLKMLAKIGGYM